MATMFQAIEEKINIINQDLQTGIIKQGEKAKLHEELMAVLKNCFELKSITKEEVGYLQNMLK